MNKARRAFIQDALIVGAGAGIGASAGRVITALTQDVPDKEPPGQIFHNQEDKKNVLAGAVLGGAGAALCRYIMK